MTTKRGSRIAFLHCFSLLAALILAAACVPVDYESSPLGTVVVGGGEEIQIRSLGTLTRAGDLGVPSQRGVALAVADYGPIKGHGVSMGAGLDSLCSAQGGAAAADTVVGDGRVVGVVGASCSVAAAGASPILSEAGLVMVAPSTTSPSLTSDLRGNAGSNYHAGYHRVSSNDLYQAEAVADFVYNELGLRTMAAIHDGDPYTSGLTAAFKAAFEELGGTVAVAMVNKGDTDMIPVLTEIAAASPEGLFLPLFPEEAGPLLRQSGEVDGLAGLVRIGGGGLLVSDFLALPESEGLYFAGPTLDFGGNVNGATGRSGEGCATPRAGEKRTINAAAAKAGRRGPIRTTGTRRVLVGASSATTSSLSAAFRDVQNFQRRKKKGSACGRPSQAMGLRTPSGFPISGSRRPRQPRRPRSWH